MRRFCSALVVITMAIALGGCGENQPNAPANPQEQSADFGQKAGEMMKTANTGMDPKNLKSGGPPAPGAMMPPVKPKR
jgi:hypothetical protein